MKKWRISTTIWCKWSIHLKLTKSPGFDSHNDSDNFCFSYLGRKILEEGETKVTSHTVKPLYSYWTLGYVLTFRGAEKLLKANPLKKLLPVDEFLPIMYNAHPKYVQNAIRKEELHEKESKTLIFIRICMYLAIAVAIYMVVNDVDFF